MTGKYITLVFIMVLVSGCLGMPLSQSENEIEHTKVQPWERRRLQMGPAGSDVEASAKAPEKRDARKERLAPLPEDQREFMSKQILQALSEILQREDCMSDYQGWVDFGRRNSD